MFLQTNIRHCNVFFQDAFTAVNKSIVSESKKVFAKKQVILTKYECIQI